MSTASASREIKYLRKSGTYMVSIVSSAGDLFQEYSGDAGDNATVKPDWTNYEDAYKPILEFLCVSSRVATGEVTLSDSQIRWFMNGTEIEFSSGTSTGTFAGLFKKTTSNGRQALKIMKNIASAAGWASATIKAVATVISGTSSDTLQATYTIPISQRSGDSYKITISAGDANNFVINSKGGSCILKANAYLNGDLIDSSTLTYKWYKLVNASWTQITGLSTTAQTYTVKEADIDTYAEFKVEVFTSGSSDAIGSDVQGVTDSTDPYMIQPNPSPSDETIEEGSGDSVVYEPRVVNRSGTALSSQPKFDFAAMDACGGYKKSDTNVAKFEVTEAMCVAAGGDITLVITSKDF
jgi:hypothetical protein